MVVAHKDGVLKVQRRAGGEGLRVCPRHHPHVLHPVLWHVHLLHVSEEVQDQPVLPHHCERHLDDFIQHVIHQGNSLDAHILNSSSQSSCSSVCVNFHPGEETHK